ncbi:MAG: DUF1476 domain-containing protein [Sphingomonadales bacterium]
MAGLDERERAFENKFAHDDELRFKTEMRRNRLLAEWAASLMGLSADEAKSYIAEVVKSDLEEAGDEDVFRKLRGDFDAKSIEVTDHKLRTTMDEKLAEAKQQVMSDS